MKKLPKINVWYYAFIKQLLLKIKIDLEMCMGKIEGRR